VATESLVARVPQPITAEVEMEELARFGWSLVSIPRRGAEKKGING
jgi:hypothetical protein